MFHKHMSSLISVVDYIIFYACIHEHIQYMYYPFNFYIPGCTPINRKNN